MTEPTPAEEVLATVLPIKIWPEAPLRELALPVVKFDDKLRQFVADMKATVTKEGGIGLAANQVGSLQRVIVVKVDGEFKEFINPVLEELSLETVNCREACLSVPGYDDTILRHVHVLISYQDLTGASHRLHTSDYDPEKNKLLAVCIQHEIDHLNGITYVDKLSSLRQDRARQAIKKWRRQRRKLA